jgi:hypothetical protein
MLVAKSELFKQPFKKPTPLPRLRLKMPELKPPYTNKRGKHVGNWSRQNTDSSARR